jgi:hypothetical protein
MLARRSRKNGPGFAFMGNVQILTVPAKPYLACSYCKATHSPTHFYNFP